MGSGYFRGEVMARNIGLRGYRGRFFRSVLFYVFVWLAIVWAIGAWWMG